MKMNNNTMPISKDNDGESIWKFLIREIKPKGKFLTPFNIISIISFMGSANVSILYLYSFTKYLAVSDFPILIAEEYIPTLNINTSSLKYVIKKNFKLS